VDIDVVFVPHGLPREEALGAIGAELAAAQARVEALGYSAVLRRSKDGTEAKLCWWRRSTDSTREISSTCN
jgi:hypothetical protein